MNKEKQIAIGMMSGTSMDGIDAVLVRFENNFVFEVLANHTLRYPKDIEIKLMEIANNKGTTKDICFMDFIVGKLFAQCANELIKKSGLKNTEIDFIASHGQTVFHVPEELEIGGIKTRSTLQIGNISVISHETGIRTIGDFRSMDVAAGGQGAPLVPFADELIFGRETSRAIQNIGGIANVTVLSPNCETFAFDTGVGNMLIDYCAKKFFGVPFDKDGQLAFQGKINEKWLEKLLSEPYYSKQPPKSTGRELFNDEYAEYILKYAPQNTFDIMATITALTAKTIVDAYKKFVLPKTDIKEVVLGGGGAYNKYLMQCLNNYADGNFIIKTHSDFNIDDKLKEAIAFALLGYCNVNKLSNNLPSCTGALKKNYYGYSNTLM